MKNQKTLLILLFLLVPLTSYAGAVQLPETGQTSCYDAVGNVILCTDPLGVGQDAAENAGAAWPSPRFVDNGDGTITDNLTGLIWLQDADRFYQLSWDAALLAANSLASDGYFLKDGSVEGDWRLPNDSELESLINAQEANVDQWLNQQGFKYVSPEGYWSATTYAVEPSAAWVVNMSDGTVMMSNKSGSYMAWPVRGH